MEQSNHRQLPISLTIASPPANNQNRLKRPTSSYFPGREPQRWADRPYLVQDQHLPGQMAQSGKKRNWPALPTSWRKLGGTKSGSQDQQDQSPVNSVYSSSPASPSPHSPSSSHKPWTLRRSGSALSPTSSKRLSQDRSPGSPKDGTKRPFRITSLIRRNQTSGNEASTSSRGEGNFSLLTVAPSPYKTKYRAYSQVDITNSVKSTTITGGSSLSATNSPIASHTLREGLSFSPAGDNPFQSWKPIDQSHIAELGPSSPIMTSRSALLPTPLRNLSNSSAPAITSNSNRVLDTDIDMQTEPEAFTSPSEFALFAEAVSSVDLMSMDSTGFVPPAFTPARTFPPQQDHHQHHHNSYQQQEENFLQPRSLVSPIRSRSVPALRSHNHTSSQGSSHLTSNRSTARNQALAEALVGLDDDRSPSDHDDELPDYEQSQAEANAHKRGEASRRARELEERWQQSRAERTRKPWRGRDQSGWMQ